MKKSILFFIACILTISCSTEKNNSQRGDILGKWKLTAIKDQDESMSLTQDDFENSNDITIVFKEEGNFVGNTVRNDFFGEYSATESNNILTIENFQGTEVNETAWGKLFYRTMNKNHDPSTNTWKNRYEIIDITFRFHFSKTEFMEFKKL